MKIKKSRIQGYYWDGCHSWVIYLTQNSKELRRKMQVIVK